MNSIDPMQAEIVALLYATLARCVDLKPRGPEAVEQIMHNTAVDIFPDLYGTGHVNNLITFALRFFVHYGNELAESKSSEDLCKAIELGAKGGLGDLDE